MPDPFAVTAFGSDPLRYRNQFLAITQSGLVLSEDKSTFTLTTRFHNLTDEMLHVGRDTKTNSRSVTTELGQGFSFLDLTDLPAIRSGRSAEDYKSIQLGRFLTIVWRGRAMSSRPINGDELSISARLFRFANGTREPFDVQMDGIDIR